MKCQSFGRARFALIGTFSDTAVDCGSARYDLDKEMSRLCAAAQGTVKKTKRQKREDGNQNKRKYPSHLISYPASQPS